MGMEGVHFEEVGKGIKEIKEKGGVVGFIMVYENGFPTYFFSF